MPTGLRRYQREGHKHFLTFSCYKRNPYFGEACARDIFEDALERTRVKYEFAISAYVVMPEHVHLLVSETPKAKLSKVMLSLKVERRAAFKGSAVLAEALLRFQCLYRTQSDRRRDI